jgi:cytochrome c oxidase assembly protein Cox11
VFKSDIDPELEWTFDPVQEEVIVNAGEPALMFYDAYNKSDDPKVGKRDIDLF